MSRRLRKNIPLLKLLSKAKTSAAKGIIKAAERDFIDSLCECCLNVLKGRVPLSSTQKKKLVPYKATLRNLSLKKHSLEKRRSLLQRGGLLPVLLPPVLGLLSSILS